MDIKRNILLTPGPATTTDTVKKSMIVQDICPREKEFVEVISDVRKGLLKVAYADDDFTCILFSGSGTSVVDAVINSVVPSGKKILIINNGAYGERMIKIAEVYKIQYVEVAYIETKPPKAEEIYNILKKDNNITHLAMVHHETTTGMLNPLEEVIRIADDLNRSLIVDAISSFAGIPINLRKDKIDYLISTSNKCLQGMPGISFVICKKQELEETKNYVLRSYYLNLYQQYDYFETNGEMRFTAPVQVVYALKQAINEYFKEGPENRYRRYVENWWVLRRGLKDMGFKFLLHKDQESYLLMTVMEPKDPNYDFKKLHDLLYERDFTVYPGKIIDKDTFRLAVTGDIHKGDVSEFLRDLKIVLHEMHIKIPVKY